MNETPKVIFLIDMGDVIVWCDDESPSGNNDDGIKYIRADLIEQLESINGELCEALKYLLEREWQDDEGEETLNTARNMAKVALAKARNE